MNKNIRHLTHAALMAALYIALSYFQNLLLPGSATWAIQFRVSEALCIFALFTPAAIGGLSVGCLLFNLSYSAALPLDFLIGTLATTLACGSMYLTRKITFQNVPLLSLIMPAIFNGLLVGWELAVYVGGGFWLNALYVAIGEAAVMLILGSSLYQVMRKRGLASRLFA